MSRALAKAAPLKPEIRLAQAVSKFEADLSAEQKIEFRALKLQSSKAAPDQKEVMRLTAKMDKYISNKFGGQCFGPRFTNFVQGVQRFAALGDVVVGGSQNLIACGVWSVVRTSLLSFVSLSAYIDKLSSLFMAIGRTAPRYQGMALLYPHSKALQSSLAEYFIIVVNLCHCLFKFGQKSSVRQFTSSLSDAHLKSFQTDLDKWANSIKEEMHVAEAQETSKSRILSREMFKSRLQEQSYADRIRVLDFCSKYDHETAWKQIRKAGNSSLHKRLVGYKEWKDSSQCTLMYIGKLGSGKSVLLANIVDDLNLSTEKDQSIVAYFFCKHDIQESLEALTILGSLTRQLLCTIANLGVLAKRYENTHVKGDIEDLLQLLIQNFPKDCKAYLILDGIDECTFEQRETLANAVRKIQEKLQISCCFSFREEPNNGLHSITKELPSTRIVPLPEENPDIENFIEKELERCLEQGLLTIGDPTLILEIQDALLKGSQGMFLWAVLQIKTLCYKKTDHAIREELANLPQDLSEMFARILQKSGADPGLQAKTLQLVIAATRPLTTDELREALSVVPGDATWDPSKLLHDVYRALACCGCLLTVDEEESTVRVVHHSVTQYLLVRHDEPNCKRFSLKKARRVLADIMITYLCYGVFGTELSNVKARPTMAQSLPSKVVQATLYSSSNRRSLAIKFLKSRKQPSFDLSQTLMDMNLSSQYKKENSFSFYQYADAHWEESLLLTSGNDNAIFRLSSKLIRLKASELYIAPRNLWSTCERAVENGNEKILRLLLQAENIDINSETTTGDTLLIRALRQGYMYKDLVKVLLSLEHIEVNATGKDGFTALTYAVLSGNKNMVETIAENRKVDINAIDSRGYSALMWTAELGSEDIVEVLIEVGKADVNKTNKNGSTALMKAAYRGHKGVVELLLRTWTVHINAKDKWGETALTKAIDMNHQEIIEILRSHGAGL